MPARFALLVAVAEPRGPEEWLATSYPTPDDLAGLHQETTEIEATNAAVDELNRRRMDRARLTANLDGARRRIEEIEREHDHAQLEGMREAMACLTAERAELDVRTKEFSSQHQRLQERSNTAAAAVEQMRQAHDLRQRERDAALAAADEAETTSALMVARLPEVWREQTEIAGEPELAAWQSEFANLEPFNDQKARLQDAQTRESKLDGAEQQARTSLAELPLEASRAPEDVEDDLNAARQRLDSARDVLDARHDEQRRLIERRQERDTLTCQLRTVVRDRDLHGELDRRLGKDGLLRELLRRAERAIVDDANRVLDRLSDGRLCLDLRASENAGGDHELDLVVHDMLSGTKEIPVELTSGSQRFRIAVCLAVAIGHYLGQEANRVQSVIIDEGFGSLDRDGLETMKQELRRLAGELPRIVLVTHQEEIAQAFPRGYAIRLVDGVSVVKRLGA